MMAIGWDSDSSTITLVALRRGLFGGLELRHSFNTHDMVRRDLGCHLLLFAYYHLHDIVVPPLDGVKTNIPISYSLVSKFRMVRRKQLRS